jgi:uncharacterized protein (TIGR02996 family)
MSEAALLAAIHAAPDDDGPRRVLADYLIERGDPRGELISVQCELARDDTGAAQRAVLEAHAEALLPAAAAAWLGRTTVLPGELTWARGLVAAVRIKAARAQLLQPALARQPVRSMTIEQCLDANAARSLGLVWPATIDELAVADAREANLLDAVLASPLVPRLRALAIRNFRLGAGAPARLAAAAPATLRELDLSNNSELRNGLRPLGERRGWSSLILRYCALGDTAATAIAAMRHVHELEQLVVTVNRIGPAGARALAGAPLAALRTLDLGYGSIGGDGAAALAEARSPALERLVLTGAELTPAGAVTLVRAPFAVLRELRLDENPLGDTVARALADTDTLPRLERLDVSRTYLSAAAVLALVRSARRHALAELFLGDNELGAALVPLFDDPAATRLTALGLSSNGLDDDAVIALAASPALGNLTYLDLAGNQLTARAARALAASSHLERLATLDLSDCPLDDDARAVLVDRFRSRVLLDAG